MQSGSSTFLPSIFGSNVHPQIAGGDALETDGKCMDCPPAKWKVHGLPSSSSSPPTPRSESEEAGARDTLRLNRSEFSRSLHLISAGSRNVYYPYFEGVAAQEIPAFQAGRRGS